MVAIFVLTVGQLLVATLAGSNLPQFADKGFGARLIAYPLLMLVVPAMWLLRRRGRRELPDVPWTAFSLVMSPFLVDVTGNTLDLYDTVDWWDDVNNFANWLLLGLGIGLMLRRAEVRPTWALGVAVAGLGAVLAIVWELAEWWTFIRHGTELDTAYTDTLGDEAMGMLGAAVAGVVLVRRAPDRVGAGRPPR